MYICLGEWYEDGKGVVHECTGYEDPDCSFQWYNTNVKDHMTYVGLYLDCETVTNVTTTGVSHGTHGMHRGAASADSRRRLRVKIKQEARDRW